MEHKDVPVLSCSRETAKSLGKEREWRLNGIENKLCAEAIIHQTQRNYGDFSAALLMVLNNLQFPEERVRNILVNEVFPDQTTTDYYEDKGRHINKDFSDKTAKWAIEAIAEQDEWDETVFSSAPSICEHFSAKAVNSMIKSFENIMNERAKQTVISKLNPLLPKHENNKER